ncbi:MAG: c-type cytochrome [Gammaproteobacteria bacterium]
MTLLVGLATQIYDQETALNLGMDPGAAKERYQVVVHVDASVLADANAPGQSVLDGGMGRYEYGVYYRPALWGPHSFNQAAGMFSDPADLAAFVRWNMPLGARGLLTDQEAWDVEAYIHSKKRPITPPSRPAATSKK